MTNRRIAQLAATLVVALVASALAVPIVAATAPPTTPEPTAADTAVPAESDLPADPAAPADNTAPADVAPDDAGVEGDPSLVEIVHSWALAPAGSLDPNEAGNRPELSYEVDQGAVLTDKVTLYNYSNVQLTFRVYATDAFNNDQGEFDLLPGSEVPTDAGSWVSMPQGLVTVPPGNNSLIEFTITVPPDALPGDHAGAIIASNETTSSDESGQIVTFDRRTGTRMYVRVSGELNAELAVTDLQTDYGHALNPLGGSAEVTFRIENRGNVRMNGTPTVSVAGPFGMGKRSVTLPDIPELLPGQDIALTAQIPDVPALMFDFTEVNIEPGSAADTTSSGSRGTDVTFAPPLATLLALLALLFGMLAWRAYRRRRAAEDAALAELADPEADRQPDRMREHQPA